MSRAFHGEFSSADASAPATEVAARFTLYEDASATIISSLLPTETLVITDIAIGCASAIQAKVFDGSSAIVSAGTMAAVGNFSANGNTLNIRFATPHKCQAGTFPKLRTSGAGQVDAVICGYIANNLQP